MTPATLLRLSLLLLAAAGFTGCAALESAFQRPAAEPALVPRGETFWDETGAAGPDRIVINLTAQRAYYQRGDRLIGESRISSGRKGFDTPPGRYKVIQKDKDHVSNLYGDYVDEDGEVVVKDVDVKKDPMPDETEFAGARMPYFLRFTGGYGMHAGNVPRYRASHGCVRLPSRMAERFFNAAALGTPVIVEP